MNIARSDRRLTIAASVLGAGILAISTASVLAQDVTRAIARLQTADGQPAGQVEFIQAEKGVLLKILVTGLTPGEHGIHLHETGSCSPDFSAAGDHFAPMGNGHGYFSPNGPHAGDLPNIFVGVDNTIAAHSFNPMISLTGDDNGLFDEDGTAVIVHALPDTYGSDAGAGDRILCGEVEPYI